MVAELALLVLIALLAIAIIIGVPIGFALFFASLSVILFDPNIDLLVISIIAMEKLGSFTLLAIPLFMYAAMLLNEYEFTDDVVELSRVLVGRFRGGLSHINVVASMFFAGVSGSSAADTAGVGGILIPAMIKKGYSRSFSASITAASSTIGNIIPPSIMMVVYGAAAEISVGALFLAGVIPGILIGVSQLVAGYTYARIYGWEGKGEQDLLQMSLAEKAKIVVKHGFFPFSIFAIIIGGITMGVFTATEAAAVATVYILLIGPLLYKKARSLKATIIAAKKAAILSAATYFAIIGASLFAYLLSYYRAIDLTMSLFTYFSLSKSGFLIVLTIIFVILGTFLDPIPIILIVTPLVVPIACELGIDPLLLGVVSVMAIRVGTMTPPYGISMLVAAGIAQIDPLAMLKDILVFTLLFISVVILIILFPKIALLVPHTFM